MNFDDSVFAPMHDALFASFGISGGVQRNGVETPVRIVINRNQESLGEYGQVVSRVTTVDFLVSQWVPRPGDVVSWTDRLGAHQRKVDKKLEDDGFVATAVLHG